MNEGNKPQQQDETQIIAERRAKLKALREKGIAFPNQFLRDSFASVLHEKYEDRDRDSMDLNPVVVNGKGGQLLGERCGAVPAQGHGDR